MKRANIDVSLLMLSCDNPRLDPTFSEDESLFGMIKNQNEKLYELASDIVEYGFSPLDIIGVYPSEMFPGYYEVGEGNRRLCALKLLLDPYRIEKINTNLFSKFQSLSNKFSSPSSIEVVVFENQEEMTHWMEIRHMGEQNGKGVSKWNSVQKMRFEKSKNGSDALLDFWYLMIDKKILSEKDVFEVTKTNWQRVLREKYYPFLGIAFNKEYYILPGKTDTFTERIRAVQQGLSGQSVGIVYDSERIETFYNNISNTLYGVPYLDVVESETANDQLEFPDINTNRPFSKDFNGNNEDNPNVVTEEVDQTNNNDSVPQKDVFNGSLTVIPYGYKIRSSNMRINKIINELKRLNPDDFPNACGTLLRALFELSAKVLKEKDTGEDQTETEFKQAIKYAANTLRNQKRITDSQHSSIMKDADDLRMIFNGYMHDTDGYPNGMALRNIFKVHKKFIEECIK